MGLLAAMTNAAMANTIPATIQSQVNACTRGLLGEGDGRYRLDRCGLAVAVLAIFLPGTISQVFAEDVRVRGYFRQDGTYVQPHMRLRRTLATTTTGLLTPT